MESISFKGGALRKYLLGCSCCLACVASLVVAPSALASAETADGCLLQGTANFSPGITATSGPFAYTLDGKLSDCHSAQAGTPESGTIEAGQAIAEQVHNTITGATDTVLYQESPMPTGFGTCEDSTMTGRALVSWADGTHTVLLYSTKGPLAQPLTGGVAASMTLENPEPPEGDPAIYTIKTNRFVPVTESVDGLVLFQPPEATSCSSAAGLASAAVSGILTIGTPVGNP
jgi:hypothetical protein